MPPSVHAEGFGVNEPSAAALERALAYPRLRWMGGKHRLLPWLADEFGRLEFSSALDAFSGTGAVSWLLKCLGKRVVSNDFLRFGATLSAGLVANPGLRIGEETRADLVATGSPDERFIAETFGGIFFTPDDLDFLDLVWPRLAALPPGARELGLAALGRAALKRQPRGVFTVSTGQRYDDGRRDLRLSLREHFAEGAALFDGLVFDDGLEHEARFGDVFELEDVDCDLVYLDPPYVPRADDNCYVKRYHFVEGLMSYWRAPEAVIMESSKVKKLEKRYSPFSYRRTALKAFAALFDRFRERTLVLSYSSNGWPDLDVLVKMMEDVKGDVHVARRPHRYSFGTHGKATRNVTEEFLIVGT